MYNVTTGGPVCPRTYLQNQWFELHQIFWPWLGRPLEALRYVNLPVLWLTTCFYIMDRAYKQATRELRVCKMTQHGFDIPKTTADNLPVYAKMTTKHFY